MQRAGKGNFSVEKPQLGDPRNWVGDMREPLLLPLQLLFNAKTVLILKVYLKKEPCKTKQSTRTV